MLRSEFEVVAELSVAGAHRQWQPVAQSGDEETIIFPSDCGVHVPYFRPQATAAWFDNYRGRPVLVVIIIILVFLVNIIASIAGHSPA